MDDRSPVRKVHTKLVHIMGGQIKSDSYGLILLLGEFSFSKQALTKLRLCKALKLNILTTVEEVAELQDPAVPASRPVYSLEVLRRALYTILFLDVFAVQCTTRSLPGQKYPYCFPEGMCNALPQSIPCQRLTSVFTQVQSQRGSRQTIRMQRCGLPHQDYPERAGRCETTALFRFKR